MLKFLIEKEFKHIFRNKFLPKLIIVLSLLMMLVMPWAATLEVSGIRVALIDNDRSPASTRLCGQIGASGYFAVTNVFTSFREAMDELKSGKTDVVFEIPRGFERDMVNGEAGKVMIAANSVNGTKATIGSSYLVSILGSYSDCLREEAGLVSSAGHLQAVPSFDVVPVYKFNPHLDFKTYMVPALMVMLITMLCGFLPALNIVSEKEIGTIEQINVTPVGKLYFVLGKLIPFWIIGIVIFSVCIALAVLVYGLVPAGSVPLIYLFTIVYILVVSGIGLIISNYSDTMQQSMFVMFFFIMVFILMSGLFTPVSGMPRWAQAITYLNPLRYFMEVMRMIYLKGSAFAEMIPQFVALCSFALCLNVWAVLSYKKSY